MSMILILAKHGILVLSMLLGTIIGITDLPFQVLERINDNAYKLDLPSSYGNVSATFNVANLSLFDVGDSLDQSTNPFKEGGNNGNQTTTVPNSNHSKDPLQGIGGLMIRAKTKHMKQALQGLVMEMKAKEDQARLDLMPKWVTFLQLIDDGSSLT